MLKRTTIVSLLPTSSTVFAVNEECGDIRMDKSGRSIAALKILNQKDVGDYNAGNC